MSFTIASSTQRLADVFVRHDGFFNPKELAEGFCHSQDLVVPQGLSGRTAIPAAVWDLPVGRDDVERVVDEVVFQNAVVGCAGGQRRRGVNLWVTNITIFTEVEEEEEERYRL